MIEGISHTTFIVKDLDLMERFAIFSSGKWQPMPWYFRTLDSWSREIRAAGMELIAVRESVNEATSSPLSIVFVCNDQ